MTMVRVYSHQQIKMCRNDTVNDLLSIFVFMSACQDNEMHIHPGIHIVDNVAYSTSIA